MNANGSGHCRRASLQNRNLITRVRGITFGLQTTALNGNCRLPEASNRDWAIVSIAYRHFGVTAPTHEQRGEEWARKRGGRTTMHHESPLWSQMSRRDGEYSFRASVD